MNNNFNKVKEYINLDKAASIYRHIVNKDSLIYNDLYHNTKMIDFNYYIKTLIYIKKKSEKADNLNFIYSTYEYSNENNEGRLNSKGFSIQRMQRKIRNTISKDYYNDIDVINCGFNIFSQLCKKNNINVKYIDDYITNREEYLNEFIKLNDITRDEAKTILIMILNGGNPSINTNEKTDNLIIEIKNNIDTLYKLKKDDIKKCIETRGRTKKNENKKENLKGQCISYIIYKIENEILMNMIKYLNKIFNNNNNDVIPIFDGCLYPKKFIITDKILNDCSILIFEKMGYKVDIITKEMKDIYTDEELKINIDYEFDNIKNYLDYETKKEIFETKIFKIISDGCYIERLDNKNIIREERQLKCSYKHLQYTNFSNEKEKKETFIDTWLCDENIKCYKDTCFLPPPLDKTHVQEGYYNLWIDFDAHRFKLDENNPTGDNIVNLWKEMLNNLIPEKQAIEYLEKFIAHLFQKPADRTRTFITLVGGEGSGKNTITELIKYMVGEEKYYETPNLAKLLDTDKYKHTEGTNNNIFFILNEVSGLDTRLYSDKFKSFITDNNLSYEKKGIQEKKTTNCNHTILLTNHRNIDDGNGRRDYIIDTTDFYMQKENEYFHYNFFKNIIGVDETRRKTANLKVLYNYFMNIDIENYRFDKFNDIKTELHKELQEINKDPVIHFLGFIAYDEPEFAKYEIRTNQLFKKFKIYCSHTELLNKRQIDDLKFNGFNCKLSKYMKNLEYKKFTSNKNNQNLYVLDLNVIKEWCEKNNHTNYIRMDNENIITYM